MTAANAAICDNAKPVLMCLFRPPIRVTASPKKPRGGRVLSFGEMAFAAHKVAKSYY